MYELNGWCSIAESTTEPDVGSLGDGIRDLEARINSVDWSSLVVSLKRVNGCWSLTFVCRTNRRRGEAEFIDKLVDWIVERFPGSYGLLYERDDDLPSDSGGNEFRVRTIARGKVDEQRDLLLSPINPTIEDWC
jgi:hypothetical protein